MARGPRETVFDRLRFYASQDFLDAVGWSVFAGADAVKAEAQHSITRGSVGGKNHVPSNPGAPPNNDSGHLRDNIEVSQPSALVGRVTSHAEYSSELEFGTSRMAARPFLRPARDKLAPKVRADLVKSINSARRKYRNANRR